MAKSILMSGLFGGLLASSAYAASGTSFGGPVGATDINNAYIPPVAGFYLGLTHVTGWADGLYGNDGKSVPAIAIADIEAVYGMYVYPFKLFSGTLASGLEEAYFDHASSKITAFGLGKQDATGWGDLYVDFLNWSRYIGPLFGEGNTDSSTKNVVSTTHFIPYGLTLKAEYSMIFPTGHYNYQIASNVTGGTYYFIPNLSMTYLTHPDFLGEGVQLNLHAFYDKQLAIQPLNYESGDVIDLDFAVAQRLGRWTAGLAGSYAFQLQDDRVGPQHSIVNGNGNHYEYLAIGPVVEYDIPKWKVGFKFKYLTPVITRNTLNLSEAVLNAFFAF